MRVLFEEYGRYAITIIGVTIAIGLFIYQIVSPNGKLHDFIELTIDSYLASDSQESYDKAEPVLTETPLTIKVAKTCKTNDPTDLTAIFVAGDGSTLKHIRVLNTGDSWSVSNQKITFTKPGHFELRIYGENDAGNFTTDSFFIGVSRA